MNALRRKKNTLAALSLVIVLIFCGCVQRPPVALEVDPSPSFLPKDSSALSGYWMGVLSMGDDQSPIYRSVFLEISNDGKASLVYCETGRGPDELPGATGLADFYITSLFGNNIDLSMHNWAYQTSGNGGLFPESCSISFIKTSTEGEFFYDETGIVIYGESLRGDFLSNDGESIGKIALVRPYADSYLSPGWIWSIGGDYPSGILGIWAPWFGSTSGMEENTILYKDDKDRLHMRSAQGWLEFADDYDDDGIVDLRIEQSLAEYFSLDTPLAPFISTFYTINLSNGRLEDISASFKEYYSFFAVPECKKIIQELTAQRATDPDNERIKSSLESYEQLLPALEALASGKLRSGDPKSVYRFSQGIEITS